MPTISYYALCLFFCILFLSVLALHFKSTFGRKVYAEVVPRNTLNTIATCVQDLKSGSVAIEADVTILVQTRLTG